MITYSAIEADSPSLVMVLSIAKTGKKGLEKKDFLSQMTDDIFVVPRIKDLSKDKMVYFDKGKYILTKKGRFFVMIFLFYRNLLNAPKGG